ncbi:transcriptional regulator, partial [Mammaliicoccus sciuri]
INIAKALDVTLNDLFCEEHSYE